MQARVVGDIMSRSVISVREEESMRTIREGMQAYGLRHIPVVDGNKLVGLLSHRDMLRFADSQYAGNQIRRALDEQRANETFAASVMTRDVQTVRAETPLAEAARTLIQHKFGCLPVTTEDGTLVGIVTEHDFLKVLVERLSLAPS